MLYSVNHRVEATNVFWCDDQVVDCLQLEQFHIGKRLQSHEGIEETSLEIGVQHTSIGTTYISERQNPQDHTHGTLLSKITRRE